VDKVIKKVSVRLVQIRSVLTHLVVNDRLSRCIKVIMEQRMKGRETETFSLYPSESRPILTQNSTDSAPQQRSLYPLLRVSISGTLSEYQLTRTLQNAMVQAEFRPREDICLRRWSSHYRRLPGEC
jgi:hypothetical protein